eukprot:745938-Hanusia_phi.AAC.3
MADVNISPKRLKHFALVNDRRCLQGVSYVASIVRDVFDQYRLTESINASAQCLAYLAEMMSWNKPLNELDNLRREDKGRTKSCSPPPPPPHQVLSMRRSQVQTMQEFEKCLKLSKSCP